MIKKLTVLITLIFTVMFSSTSFAEWTWVAEHEKTGSTLYVDFERIRKHDGYVYFWYLHDRLKPTDHEVLSSQSYIQGDWKLFRIKGLSYSFHKQPMGEGAGVIKNLANPEWNYAPPNSGFEVALKAVCEHVN